MNEVLKVYLSVSLSGTLLMLILLALRPLYKNRLSKSWQYYIWLVVILRLLIPYSPKPGIAGQLFQKTAAETGQLFQKAAAETGQLFQKTAAETGQSESRDAQPFSIQNPLESIRTEGRTGNDWLIYKQPGLLKDLQERATILAQNIQLQNRLQDIWFIWLAAAFALLIRKVTVYQSFVKYLRASCEAVNDITLLEQLGRIMEQNHIKGTVGLYTNKLVASPLLVGFFRPNIILTADTLSRTDFHYTALHELMHYKRLDMFYKWLVQLTVCLHWFNPFVYLMEREVGRMCELSCDEMVIRNLDDRAKREYGNTLLNAMGTGGFYQNSLASITLNKGKELLKERMESIMRYRKKTKIAAIVSAALALSFTGIVAGIGAYIVPVTAGEKAKASAKSETKNETKNEAKNETKNEAKNDKLTLETYQAIGITKSKGAYFYKGKRIRILMDLKADRSFVNFHYDKKGTADLKLSRAKNGTVSKVTYLTKAEANEILKDMGSGDVRPNSDDGSGSDKGSDTGVRPNSDDGSGSGADSGLGAGLSASAGSPEVQPEAVISRLDKDELPNEVLEAIRGCDANKWYVVKGKGCRYIYYGGLPYNYAFQPIINEQNQSTRIHISDIGNSTGNYVLLAVIHNGKITVTYNGKSVVYTEIVS